MAVRTYAAARYICQKGKWQVTNLALQKVLYLAHMMHFGRTRSPLIKPHFEAWDYGPVVPKLYARVRDFGADPVRDVFTAEEPIVGTPEEKTLAVMCDSLLKLTPAQLVALTHEEGGAWAKNYTPGVRGIEIPEADILLEYQRRAAARLAA